MEVHRHKNGQTEIYNFKKGQRLHLDSIYDIQAVAGGKWWVYYHLKGINYSDESSDEVIITKNIKITISWETK